MPLEIKVGETCTLGVTVSPSNATNKSVTWSSSNTAVATVDCGGTVTGKSVGSVTISATANDGSGKKGIGTFNVAAAIEIPDTPIPTAPLIFANKITLSQEKLNLLDGMNYQYPGLTATVEPEIAYDKRINWFSSSDKVASVSEGNVRTVSHGEAIITAKSYDGVITSNPCKVTVFSFDDFANATLKGEDLGILPVHLFWSGSTGTGTSYINYTDWLAAKIDISDTIQNIYSGKHFAENIQKVINMYTLARIFQKETGIPAAIATAQWIHESGWGKPLIPENNNYFGIVAFGNQAYIPDGAGRKFRTFSNAYESFMAYYSLLQSGYAPLVKTNTLDGWAQALVDGGYCGYGVQDYGDTIFQETRDWGLVY